MTGERKGGGRERGLDPQNVWNGLTPMANFDRLEISVNFPRTRFTLRNTESCLGFGRLPEKWPSYQFSHILVDRHTKWLVVPRFAATAALHSAYSGRLEQNDEEWTHAARTAQRRRGGSRPKYLGVPPPTLRSRPP